MAGVPYVFASATTSIPLSQLDADFNTPVTIGNTSVGLGNTVTSFGNVTLTNPTIIGGTSTANATAIVNGTSNVSVVSSGGAVTISTNGTSNALVVDTSQNVGVNTANPSAYGKLVVSGGGFTQLATLALPSTSGSTRSDFTRVLDVAGSRSLDSGVSSSGAWVQSRDKNDYSVNYDLLLQPNGGNLLVGVTSGLGGKLSVYQSTAGSYSAAFKSTKDGSNNSYFHVFLNDAGSTVGYIYTVAQTGTSYFSVSDRRLKSNITDITTSGEFIDALKPRNFTWTDANVVDQGFIADEFQTVVPLAVNGQANAVDSDGNPVYQAIEASSAQVIANLVAEVKSLRARLKAANIA